MVANEVRKWKPEPLPAVGYFTTKPYVNIQFGDDGMHSITQLFKEAFKDLPWLRALSMDECVSNKNALRREIIFGESCVLKLLVLGRGNSKD